MISREAISNVKATAGKISAVVIGDTMLDRYIYGHVDRISPEAPVPILTHQSTELKAGGAANVALNLASWGCDVSLIGIAGNDVNRDSLKSILSRYLIKNELLVPDERPTTVKTRVVASSHHLLRIDEESTSYLQGETETRVIGEVIQLLRSHSPDLIIIQDYNKGFLTENLIRQLVSEGKKKNAFIAVDPKEQNFFEYRQSDLLKPNFREAGHASKMNLKITDLPDLTRTWLEKLDIGTIAVTLGSQGIFLQNQQSEVHVKPEKSIDVVDVCGAGDAVICSLALALMTGLDLRESGSLANITGAYVCSHSGVVAANPDEIMTWI